MRLILTTAIAGALALGGGFAFAAPAAGPQALPAAATHAPMLWHIKNDGQGKGHKKEKSKEAKGGKAKGHDKAEKANKPEKAQKAEKSQKSEKALKAARPEKRPGKDKRTRFSAEERRGVVERFARVTPPANRDMRRLAEIGALGLLGGGLLASDLTADDYYTYRNCPPGLAKKDPPCVPPGLAKKGVTYDEWASYDEDRLDDIWIERRRDILRNPINPDDSYFLLTSDQVAALYGLAPAPAGQRYALIDGMPVLLDQDDYASLLYINELAGVTGLPTGIDIAPTAALTQDELIRLYRLPQLDRGYNYAVLNGQVIRLSDSEYETLQLIRIARAVL